MATARDLVARRGKDERPAASAWQLPEKKVKRCNKRKESKKSKKAKEKSWAYLSPRVPTIGNGFERTAKGALAVSPTQELSYLAGDTLD